MEEDQMILDNIDEFINDENKIVTYKWLSLTLSLHVLKARRLLEDFLKKTEHELNVIYFVGGRKKDSEYTAFQYRLARKSSLDDIKSTFDEITTCHIYSIQKSPLKDADILYGNDIDVVNESLFRINKYSAIQCNLVKNLDETLLKRGANDTVPVVNGIDRVKIVKKPEQREDMNKVVAAKEERITSQNNKESSKKTSAVSFFGKQPKDDGSKKSNQCETAKIKTMETVNSGKSKEMSDKVSTKPKVDKVNISSAFMKSKKTSKPVEESNGKEQDLSKYDISKGEEGPMDPSEKSPLKRKDTIKMKEQSTLSPEKKEEEKKRSKKRKAVIEESESDEEDFERFLSKSKDCVSKSDGSKLSEPKEKKIHSEVVESSSESLEVLASTSETIKKKPKKQRKEKSESESEKEKVKNYDMTIDDTLTRSVKEDFSSKSNVNNEAESKDGGKRRGRRRVLKAKQYVNEDGYMVTKKEYESESFSEESDMEISEEKIKTLSNEKKHDVVKKKVVNDLEKKTKAHLSKPKHQASLMNFFKKK